MATFSTNSSGSSSQNKSGLKVLQPGEILFNENDQAQSLYIIQKGQIRLFRPKGRGFIDLAVLRAGEVIGEMAYFDANSRKRSASASAIMHTEVIEISFGALDKTMTSLNPWFKTLITTLAERLRKSNEKVKSLENNSLGFGSSGKTSEYKFFQSQDLVRILSLFFLVFKSHGTKYEDGSFVLPNARLKMYAFEIFNIQEAKYEEFLHVLKEEMIVANTQDIEGLPAIKVQDPEIFRQLQVFFNAQRLMDDTKKLTISAKCEKFLTKVLEQIGDKEMNDDGQVQCNLSEILEWFKERNIAIGIDDFKEALAAKFCGDLVVGAGSKMFTMVQLDYLKKMFPVVRFQNAINRVNESKARQGA